MHIPVGSKQPPPRRVVPLAMHVEESPKNANSPTSGAGLRSHALRQRPEESDTHAGALGTALYTYQVGFMQPPPRRLCPGRCTQRVKIYVKAAFQIIVLHLQGCTCGVYNLMGAPMARIWDAGRNRLKC